MIEFKKYSSIENHFYKDYLNQVREQVPADIQWVVQSCKICNYRSQYVRAAIKKEKNHEEERIQGLIDEFLMASWPFGSHSMTEEMKEFLKTNPDIDNYDDDLRFCNIIIRDMVKIDVYEQLMMNIDILVDILNDEFLMKNKKQEVEL